MIYGDHPPFTDDELREIRRTLDEKWAELDRTRNAEAGTVRQRMLDRQLRIERIREKL